jgi:hypothetical protein
MLRVNALLATAQTRRSALFFQLLKNFLHGSLSRFSLLKLC